MSWKHYLDVLSYYLQVVIFVLISVAFLTLLERKVLSYAQNRKGPNKVGFVGLLQPFADAAKLFSKEEIMSSSINFFFFFLSPMFGFFISLLLWLSLVSFFGFLDFKFSVVFLLFCLSLTVYGLVFSGWASNSKYALLGSLRAVAQTISYEIILSFIFFGVALLAFSYSLQEIFYFQSVFLIFYCGLGLFFLCFLAAVAETNRAPFDLAEGESELVSGFNVEYGGLKFALLFLAEYANIIWMSFFLSVIFFSSIFVSGLLVMFFLFFRAAYPRVRYDFLMQIMWKSMLSVILFYFIFLCVLGL